jgi:hypothetical protein
MFQALDNSTLEEFTEIFQQLEGWTDKTRPYNSIYVSIGGKQNELYQTFHFPPEIKDKKFRSNASFQMIPAFIANRRPDSRGDQPPDRILLVIIDSFRSTEDWSTNCRIIQNRDQTKSETSLYDILVWNQDMNTRTLIPTIRAIIQKTAEQNITPRQCMICNFVRFSHPNDQELAIEEYIPIQIQATLDKTPYAKCFYQWWGPSVYTYNIVYCYKDYDICRSMYCSQLHRLFEKYSPEYYPIRQTSIEFIKEGCEEDIRFLNIVNQFAQFNVDITESFRRRGEIASNMMM